MRKIWLWLLPLMFFLAACQAGGGVAVENRTNTDVEADSPSTTSDSAADAAQDESPVDAPSEPLNNEITIGQNPDEASVVRERDWTKGAEDPLVTIIEYGDFQ